MDPKPIPIGFAYPCPNPKCESNSTVMVHADDGDRAVGCSICGLVGPIGCDSDEAADNWALLPRAEETVH